MTDGTHYPLGFRDPNVEAPGPSPADMGGIIDGVASELNEAYGERASIDGMNQAALSAAPPPDNAQHLTWQTWQSNDEGTEVD